LLASLLRAELIHRFLNRSLYNSEAKMTAQRKLNVVELYAGTARSVEPFRRWSRCKIALLVDVNAHAKKTYLKNHSGAPYYLKDLGKTDSKWISETAGGVDILLGCPPCQGFSDNGRRNPWDRRNRHLRKFAELATELKPQAIAMENVPLAVGARAFKDFTRMITSAGYYWTGGIVNSALYGSCQCRQRLLFVAIRKDAGSPPEIPLPTHGGRRRYFNYRTKGLAPIREARTTLLGVSPATLQVRDELPYREGEIGNLNIPTIGQTFADLPEIGTIEARRLAHVAWAHTPNQRRRMGKLSEGGQASLSRNYYASSYGRLHREGLARTITGAFPNAGSGRFWHPTENRSITLREAARIQGFSDSFQFIEPFSESAQLVGNALDAALANLTYKIIKKCLRHA
jgi:DNA (cytosine-5)-methyltransferase 1